MLLTSSQQCISLLIEIDRIRSQLTNQDILNMPKVKKKVAQRKTQISISLPQELVERIDVLAAKENRNRSNFISNALTQRAAEIES